ncbi:MAG: DedA family protein [Nitrososphaerota archaeon]|nr:DedA family protein [Nitrososphaerota archaeon]MDG6930217.1 DedA family protein [Nitrososphaerota archaeon]MDG6931442.1 DedA family protein [Nitrososphaerota archaeon]MDG6936564.1 DedA family protein [Nitrososphaerota archaeon]MDG6944217.1 DedA family protein [Nitrososphaerota archaeon]
MNRTALVSVALGIVAAIGVYALPQGTGGTSFLKELIYIIPAWAAYEVSAGGPVMVFALMALESASLPIPSEVILPLSGFLIAQGKMELVPVFISSLAGSMVGSIADYYIGYVIGMEAIYKKSWISSKSLMAATSWFNKYGGWAVTFSRMLAGARTLISFPAGAFKMEIKRFSLYTLVGSALWSGVLVYLGMVLGSHWASVEGIINRTVVPLGVGFIVALAFYLIYSLLRSPK